MNNITRKPGSGSHTERSSSPSHHSETVTQNNESQANEMNSTTEVEWQGTSLSGIVGNMEF